MADRDARNWGAASGGRKPKPKPGTTNRARIAATSLAVTGENKTVEEVQSRSGRTRRAVTFSSGEADSKRAKKKQRGASDAPPKKSPSLKLVLKAPKKEPSLKVVFNKRAPAAEAEGAEGSAVAAAAAPAAAGAAPGPSASPTSNGEHSPKSGAAGWAATGDVSTGKRADGSVAGAWSPEEDAALRELVSKEGAGDWTAKAQTFAFERSETSLRKRWHKLQSAAQHGGGAEAEGAQPAQASSAKAKPSLTLRFPNPIQGKDWTEEEDGKLREVVATVGTTDWAQVAERVGHGRQPQDCRGRWRRLTSGETKAAAAAASPAAAQAAQAAQAAARAAQAAQSASGHAGAKRTTPASTSSEQEAPAKKPATQPAEKVEDYWTTYWAKRSEQQAKERHEKEEALRQRKARAAALDEIYQELRKSPDDGLPYTKSEFEAEYGGLKEWEAAPQVEMPVQKAQAEPSPHLGAVKKKLEAAQKATASAKTGEAQSGAVRGMTYPQSEAVAPGITFNKVRVNQGAGGPVDERLIVEAVDEGGPAAKCGVEAGLILSHIGSGATGHVFSNKRKVEGLVFGDVLRTIKLTPRPLMLFFSGRAEIPKLSAPDSSGKGPSVASNGGADGSALQDVTAAALDVAISAETVAVFQHDGEGLVRDATDAEIADEGTPEPAGVRTWTVDEDRKLLLAIDRIGHGESDWTAVATAIGSHRSSLSCKSRWARLKAVGVSVTKTGAGAEKGGGDESAASRETPGAAQVSSAAGDDRASDLHPTSTSDAFASAAAGLAEVRRISAGKAPNTAQQRPAQQQRLNPTVQSAAPSAAAKVRVEDLAGNALQLYTFLRSAEPRRAVHGSAISFQCTYCDGARTSVADLQRACASIYGQAPGAAWRLEGTKVIDVLAAVSQELSGSRQYTLVRQMNWWACNSCGKDVDHVYPGGACCTVYGSMKSISKNKRTQRRCRAIPHFVKNMEMVEISDSGARRVCKFVVPPVDWLSGSTQGD